MNTSTTTPTPTPTPTPMTVKEQLILDAERHCDEKGITAHNHREGFIFGYVTNQLEAKLEAAERKIASLETAIDEASDALTGGLTTSLKKAAAQMEREERMEREAQEYYKERMMRNETDNERKMMER